MIQESLLELDPAAVSQLVDELNAIGCDGEQMTDNQWYRYYDHARHAVEPYEIIDPARVGLDWESMQLEEFEDGNLSDKFYKHGILCDQIDPAIHDFIRIIDKLGY
jgi:hypothetical protein